MDKAQDLQEGIIRCEAVFPIIGACFCLAIEPCIGIEFVRPSVDIGAICRERRSKVVGEFVSPVPIGVASFMRKLIGPVASRGLMRMLLSPLIANLSAQLCASA